MLHHIRSEVFFDSPSCQKGEQAPPPSCRCSIQKGDIHKVCMQKFEIFRHPSPCTDWLLIYAKKSMQPPLLRPLFHDPPPRRTYFADAPNTSSIKIERESKFPKFAVTPRGVTANLPNSKKLRATSIRKCAATTTEHSKFGEERPRWQLNWFPGRSLGSSSGQNSGCH